MICNSYVFYDTIYEWITYQFQINKSPSKFIIESFVKLLADQMTQKKWKPLAREYIEDKTNTKLVGLTSMILRNSSLITSSKYYRVTSVSEYTPEELFARDHDIKFKLNYDCECEKQGDCGFILRVTAASGKQDDSFNIELLTDTSLYPDSDDIHFHKDSLSADNIHIAIDISLSVGDVSGNNRPVTWQGKPYRDETSKFWCWGRRLFYRKEEGKFPARFIYPSVTYCGSTAKIRPVVYYSDSLDERKVWFRKLFQQH